MTHCVIVTTCPSNDEAQRIAQHLISAKLAACVQISAAQSVYSWQGQMCNDSEYQLLIKTRQEHYGAVEQEIQHLHSYEVPEIIMIAIAAGSSAYLNWLGAETAR